MCRVFGFRSALPSAVHHSLIRARNGLALQSRQHPDGWGIACYDGARPMRVRGTGPAFVGDDFSRAADMVSSQTVLAHVRQASCGGVDEENCHPFLRGRWAFAHNGDVRRWEQVRPEVEGQIAPHWLETLRGETDSERCFLLFLTALEKKVELESDEVPFEAVAAALTEVIAILRAIADTPEEKPSVLTFVVANGPLLAAVRSGNTLWYSTHKVRCPQRNTCAMLMAACERPSEPGREIRHLLLASEPLSTDNVWNQVPHDAVIGVAGDMFLRLQDPAVRPQPEPQVIGLGI